MKKIRYFVALFFTTSLVTAQVQLPKPSPTQTIKQEFGMSYIELTYSRPGLKGRKIIGEIEPYNVIWRTGANAATRIKFGDAVEILGHKVDSGTYVIYTIPQKNDDWTFILNRGITNSGVDGYKETEDVFRAKVKPMLQSPKLETLTMQFANVKPESCDLRIMWEDLALTIPITTNIRNRLRAQVEQSLSTEKPPYWAAAQFYFEYDNDNAKALDMINKAIVQNAKTNPFFMIYYKAKIQKQMGDKAGARTTAKESIAASKLAKNDNYVLLNERLLKELN